MYVLVLACMCAAFYLVRQCQVTLLFWNCASVVNLFNLAGLWDKLLKGRIELQKVVTNVNQLPQPDSCNQFMSSGGEQYATLVKEGMHVNYILLDNGTSNVQRFSNCQN